MLCCTQRPARLHPQTRGRFCAVVRTNTHPLIETNVPSPTRGQLQQTTSQRVGCSLPELKHKLTGGPLALPASTTPRRCPTVRRNQAAGPGHRGCPHFPGARGEPQLAARESGAGPQPHALHDHHHLLPATHKGPARRQQPLYSYPQYARTHARMHTVTLLRRMRSGGSGWISGRCRGAPPFLLAGGHHGTCGRRGPPRSRRAPPVLSPSSSSALPLRLCLPSPG